MLEVNNVTCERGRRQIFSNITFVLRPGQLLLLLGANGSGKTSLLKMLAGLLAPVQGNIVRKQRPLYIGHKLALNSSLTAIENLNFLLTINNCNGVPDLTRALQQFALNNFHEIPVAELSAGQCQKIALTRLLLQSAPLWLLDEPFTALDSQGVAVMQNILSRHLTTGGSAVIAMHHPQDFLQKLCTREILL